MRNYGNYTKYVFDKAQRLPIFSKFHLSKIFFSFLLCLSGYYVKIEKDFASLSFKTCSLEEIYVVCTRAVRGFKEKEFC